MPRFQIGLSKIFQARKPKDPEKNLLSRQEKDRLSHSVIISWRLWSWVGDLDGGESWIPSSLIVFLVGDQVWFQTVCVCNDTLQKVDGRNLPATHICSVEIVGRSKLEPFIFSEVNSLETLRSWPSATLRSSIIESIGTARIPSFEIPPDMSGRTKKNNDVVALLRVMKWLAPAFAVSSTMFYVTHLCCQTS